MTRRLRQIAKAAVVGALAAVLSLGSALPASATEPDETTISGTVTGTDGDPIAGVTVLLDDPEDKDFQRWAGTTDATGAFTYTSKHTGTFTLKFTCNPYYCDGSYETRWLGGAKDVAGATTFELLAGVTVQGLDAVLPPAAVISGVVRTTDGAPIKGAHVRAYLPGPVVWTTVVGIATTNELGEYAIRSLPGGTYRVEISHENPVGVYHDQFWPGVRDVESAGPIEVAEGTVVSDVDATLVRTSSIHGWVFDAEGSPFGWATVWAKLFEYPAESLGSPVVAGHKYVDGTGFYWFNGLHAGTYALCYEPNWVPEDCTPGSEWMSEPFQIRAEEQLTPTTRLSGGLVHLAGPIVTGTAAVGSTLSATASSTTTGATLEYAWLAGGEPLEGETGPTLSLEPAHLGADITVRVTASAPDRITTSRTLGTPLRVKEGTLTAPPLNVMGDTVVGQTLTAVPGEWSDGTALTYEWAQYRESGWHVLSTEPTLRLTSDHIGTYEFWLVVRGTKPGFTEARRSIQLGAVVLGIADLSPVTVTGTAAAGSTLTAVASSQTPGAHLRYRWYADGVPVPSADSSHLELLDEHAGAMITAEVTAVAKDYRNSTTRTAALGPIKPYPWGTTSRLAGADRYATSVAVSRSQFAPGVDTVFIASGAAFPDALAGAGVAALRDGPLLLTPAAGLPQAVIDEIKRLKPTSAVIFGGTGAVSAKVQQQLYEIMGYRVPSRFSGADRYATSVAISKMEFSPLAPPPVVYIANGSTFPDALSGAPLAGQERGPLLLSTATAIPASVAAELDRLNPGRIVVLGGTGAISDAVAHQLETYTSGGVTRLAGADRYATSAAISKATFKEKVPVAYIANGADFPDALSGAPVAAIQGGPVLLTPASSLPSAVVEELERLRPKRVVILGGTGSVSSTVQAQLDALG